MKGKNALEKGTILKSPKHTYKIEEVLGFGGFGITYKVSAEIKVGNIPVKTFFCIKEHYMEDCCYRENKDEISVSKTQKGVYADSLADFKSEASRLNSLSGKHKGIVRVNEVFNANNTVYYVMEYLNGKSIRNVVNENGPYSEENALHIISEVGSAIAFLHSQTINHLDIKPDNIMLHDYGTGNGPYPVLIDFGLAKHYDSKGNPTSTIRLHGCSEGYSPIEQYVKIDKFSPVTDVYSLAATLYFMLTGKNPPIALEVKEDNIVEALTGKASARSIEAIAKAMRSNKEQRSQNVNDFLNALTPMSTYLPFGHRIKLGGSFYLITSVYCKTDNVITYIARKSSSADDEATNGNLTVTQEYLIKEYYNEGNCHRNEDGSVIIDKNNNVNPKSFFNGKDDKSGILHTNGTYYSIETKKDKKISTSIYWIAAIVFAIIGYMSVDIPDWVSQTGSTELTDSTIGDVAELEDTTLVDENMSEEKEVISNSVNNESVNTADNTAKTALMDAYIKKAEACCDKAEKKSGNKAMIQVLLDAKFFYYDKARTLHKEIYGKDIETNARLNKLVIREYDYWVKKGNSLGKSKKNYARKKACYENAYKLVENKTIKVYIEWLDKRL